MVNKKPDGIPMEQLKHIIEKTTPAMRLKWLEEAQEFVSKNVSPQKLENWKKIQK